MISINIKKGYDLPIKGNPSLQMATATPATHVAAVPERIPYIKPKLQVDIGDTVTIGSLLFIDKKRPELKFLSPGGGTVAQINYGHRRVIQEIVIELSNEEKKAKFASISEEDLNHIDREDLVRLLMDGGVWPYLKSLPYREIARPESLPHAIWVVLDNKDPFQPLPELYLKNNTKLFYFGLNILKKFSPNIHVTASSDNSYLFEHHKQTITHTFTGCYPADDPGVVLYHTKKSSEENSAWYIHAQDLILLAQMAHTGIYPTQRIIALSDISSGQGMHMKTRLGTKVNDLLPAIATQNNSTYIAGGIFKGYMTQREKYLSFYDTSISIVPEFKKKELFGFLRPGFDRESYSRLFLSILNRSVLTINNDMHGEERSCINCGTCAQVCAVDILPQFMYKSLQAGEMEEALSHGLLDCVECGLCTYVCPSKIELSALFIAERRTYYQEQLAE